MALIIPELVLIDTLNKLLAIVRDDYATNVISSTEEDSYLYMLFNGLVLDSYDMYENAKKVIITNTEDPNHIAAVTLAFNRNSGSAPAIVLNTPGESTNNNSLSIGEGDFDEIIVGGEYRKQFNRRWLATYSLMFVGENKVAIIILYHLFKSLLVSAMNHLAVVGIENLKIGGQDLNINISAPDSLFMKNITLNFEYEQRVPEFGQRLIINRLLLYWKPEGAVTRSGPLIIDADDPI